MGEIAIRTPHLSRWGSDPWSFNLDDGENDDGFSSDSDGSGDPGRGIVGAAIVRWAEMTGVADPSAAAIAFNIPFVFAADAFRPDLFPASDLDEAIQLWSMLVGGTASIDLAAVVFGMMPAAVRGAIAAHPYLLTCHSRGIEVIVHEGE